ncbi:MAG: hypothetical protein AAFY28_00620 [Actinomycetota bacterium]
MGKVLEAQVRSVVWAVTAAALAVVATLVVTSAWSADAAPGDSDATYVPTPGCRAFDLRPGADQVGPRPTPLGAREVYTQQITGGVGECVGALAIPADAVAVAMNVTVVNPTAQSNLRLFPANLTEVPLVSNLNFSAGQAPFPNKVDVALSPGGAVKIYNQNGTVSVLGDVVGYFTKASLTEIADRLATLEAAQASAATIADVELTKHIQLNVFGRAEESALQTDFGDPNDWGVLAPSIAFGLTLPPDYTAGTDMVLRVTAYALPADAPCLAKLRYNAGMAFRQDEGSTTFEFRDANGNPNQIFALPERTMQPNRVAEVWEYTFAGDELRPFDSGGFELFWEGGAGRCTPVVVG